MAVQRRNQRTPQSGYSLLELVMAIALVTATLAPALVLMRDGMDVSRATDYRLLLTNYAVQQLEERMALVAAAWPEGTSNGDFNSDGFPEIRYSVTTSDALLSGGIPDELMHIEVTTYLDENSNDSQDAGEASCYFRTKIANLNSYVEKAGS